MGWGRGGEGGKGAVWAEAAAAGEVWSDQVGSFKLFKATHSTHLIALKWHGKSKFQGIHLNPEP